MTMQNTNDSNWDAKLNISTETIDYSHEDSQNYGYDPTPYAVLEELVKLNILKKEDVVVDYGCGKGRISFFINNQVGCKVIGIDHSEKLIENANINLQNYGNSEDIVFICSKAEEYIPTDANCFYFFNPFSTKIFRQVLEKIEQSNEMNPREILIFFYYSTIEYKMYLPTEPRLELVKTLHFNEDKIGDCGPSRLSIFKFRQFEIKKKA